ncbi:hypothetical protein JRO89_XS09G0201800 [Xanthoceras sorbifolium]|uniref:Mediator of RNA polymerase II transcription subunit 6 n=1 Tax=Xanthoceras sorbifolium TaxID=99658 RepID=A0ABQ8HM16_9ROSI|nr:hypothetical protein JRO89_XS09G0201800 [Xanthoceras sorbifolium]
MATPMPGANFEVVLPPPVAPPGTDMTGICFRDQLWLNSYPLDRNMVFDYFALSPFYDWTCNNEQLRMRSIHPLDISQLSYFIELIEVMFPAPESWIKMHNRHQTFLFYRKMTGLEYMLSEVMEPHLFVIRKQKRDSPEKVTPMLSYYILDGSIYQAPQLCNVFAARIGRALYYIQKAFTTAASKLEKIGYVDAENEGATLDTKVVKETIDFKEVKRIDHILASLQRKLPPAPPPPPFPEGYTPPTTGEAENGPETQQAGEQQPPPVDPIIDQGPAKRMKF